MTEPSTNLSNCMTSFPSQYPQVINHIPHQVEDILMIFSTRCHHIWLNWPVIPVMILWLKSTLHKFRINITTAILVIGIPNYKDKPVLRPLCLKMGIPILVRWNLYIAMAPWMLGASIQVAFLPKMMHVVVCLLRCFVLSINISMKLIVQLKAFYDVLFCP